ncbi:MAG TPA: prolyl oligopeptidase family serine peptidase [Methylomirabilota bacterium]|nr:prolyl oligopeptidase family serine peptidase [Methylomirabilota bacterium]
MIRNRPSERRYSSVLGQSLWGLALLSCIFLAPAIWRVKAADAEAVPSTDHVSAPPATQVNKITDDYFGTAVLLLTGDSDTRVAPLHARKMTALLQADAAPERPILLHYDTHAGHSGGTPISQQVTDSARIFAFLEWQLGAPIQ